MKKINIILLLLLITAVPTTAEKGIVLNESNYVQYKFDTKTLPELQAGEWIIFAPNINDIQKDAWWNGAAFVNPIPALPPEIKEGIKNRYQNHINNLTAITQASSMTEAQQTGAIKQLAYVGLDILNFLKWMFGN